MGVITFNGVSSERFGILVELEPNYEYPERDYELVHVPGRNGDIVIDKGSYKNVTRSYYLAVGKLDQNFVDMANNISKWLHSASGYARLEDTYEPKYYRLAMYREGGTINNLFRHAGRINVKFDCKPQRYLKSGEQKIVFIENGQIVNPTEYEARPMITVIGAGDGNLRIGSTTVSVSGIEQSITIDSELGDAYKGTLNLNSKVRLSNGFPTFKPGINEIIFSGGITSVEVVPKWWTL